MLQIPTTFALKVIGADLMPDDGGQVGDARHEAGSCFAGRAASGGAALPLPLL